LITVGTADNIGNEVQVHNLPNWILAPNKLTFQHIALQMVQRNTHRMQLYSKLATDILNGWSARMNFYFHSARHLPIHTVHKCTAFTVDGDGVEQGIITRGEYLHHC